MSRDAILLDGHARPLAHYPHARRAGDLLFVSGVSSRRADDTWEGVTVHPDGRVDLDVREQTRAVIENIRRVLRAAGVDLDALVDVTTFLVDMADYGDYNTVYNTYFDAATGPARTTVAVRELPHPYLRIEMKAVARIPVRDAAT